jgi:xanthine/uracil permease
MSSIARSAARKPAKASRPVAKPAPIAAMTEAERKALKARFAVVMGATIGCCIAAFVGMVGNVSLHQWWGMPLFVLAMIGGFGAQIVFIVGLVRANRTDKGA